MTPFSDTVFARLLRRLARVVCRHPRWFVYPQIGLALAGVLYTADRLKLDMNRSHLVGDEPAAAAHLPEIPEGIPEGRRAGGGRAERPAGAQPPVCRAAGRPDCAGDQSLHQPLLQGRPRHVGAQGAAAGADQGPGRNAPGLARVPALHSRVCPGHQSQLPVPPGEQTIPHRSGGRERRDRIPGPAHPVSATPHRAGQAKPAAPGHAALTGRRNPLCRGRTGRTIDLPRLRPGARLSADACSRRARRSCPKPSRNCAG